MRKQTLADWKNHPVTQVFLSTIKKRRDKIRECIVLGQYLNTESLFQLNRFQSALNILDELITLRIIEDETIDMEE